MSFFDIVNEFRLSPIQIANFLWGDVVFQGPNEECHYLKELTPEQIRGFGEFLLIKADEIEAGGMVHES